MDVPSSAQRRSQRQAKRSEPSTPRIDQTVPEPESIEVAADSGDGSIRCVCGFDEYPGLPIIPSERQISRSKSKSSSTVDDGLGAFPEVEIGSPGDWFIQCDRCEAWQHGGCIGLILQSSAPQSYLCEQCDPSFHSLGTDVNG